jgi:hypothetical protein
MIPRGMPTLMVGRNVDKDVRGSGEAVTNANDVGSRRKLLLLLRDAPTM